MLDKSVKAIRVLLVEDHRIVRAGLRMLIESQPHMIVVGDAANHPEARSLAAEVQPDVILLDLCLGDEICVERIGELVAAAPEARILLLTAVTDANQHRRAFRLGAVGVVSKEQAVEVLLKAIVKVYDGEVWMDRAMMAHVLADLTQGRGAVEIDPNAAIIATLTKRERDVIALVCQGLQNRTVGDRLSITETTVRHHLTAIFNRLGVANRMELVIYAYRYGLAKPPAV